MSLLEQLRDPVVLKGLAQVAVASGLATLVLGVSFLRDLDLESELGRAFARGFVQVVAMGAFIGILFSVPFVWSGAVVLAMITIAAWISRNRGEGVPGAFRAALVSILFGSGLVIVTMLAAGAIAPTVRNLIPVGGMIIANAMKTNSLAIDRFKSEIQSNRREIEAVLALGAPPERVLSEYATTSVRASLIPMVDSLKSLGLVYIPGMMSGMILAGANPIYAAEYQFVIMAMLFAAGGLTSMTSTLLVRRYAFTDAEQLKPFGGVAPDRESA